MKTLTASDRSTLVRLASSLPKGDATRRAILAGLKKAASKSPSRNRDEAFAEISAAFRDGAISPSDYDAFETRPAARLESSEFMNWWRAKNIPGGAKKTAATDAQKLEADLIKWATKVAKGGNGQNFFHNECKGKLSKLKSEVHDFLWSEYPDGDLGDRIEALESENEAALKKIFKKVNSAFVAAVSV